MPNVIGRITPDADLGTFPVAYAEHLRGGLHAVADLTARDLIPSERRIDGMEANLTDGTKYQLAGGIGNANWQIVGASKTLFVDKNGVDATAIRGRSDKPYLTIAAAKSAAVSGDCICVAPGSYTVTAQIGKTGVNYYLAAGVTIVMDGSGLSGIIDDSAGALVCSIDGHGILDYRRTTGAADLTAYSGAINVTNAASDIQVRCKQIINRGTATTIVAYAVWQADGILHLDCHRIDVTYLSGTGIYCIGWEKGSCYITADVIQGGGGSTVHVLGSATPNGDLYIRAKLIAENFVSSPMIAMVSGLNPNTRVWIEANEIRHVGTGTIETIQTYAGKLYITAQKIGGLVTANQVVAWAGGQLWLTCQKMTANGSRWLLISKVAATSADQLWVRCEHFEDGNNTITRGFDISMSGTGGIVSISGQRLILGTSGVGIYKSALTGQGAVTIDGLIINTAANVSGTGYPVQVNLGNMLTLKDCVLIADAATDSIFSASSGRSVRIYGHCMSNRAVNANITLAPLGVFTVDSAVN